MATGASRRARERLRAARRLLFEQVPEQLGRLEHYGAHLARQQDQARAQLERLEHYGAHVSGQNDRSLAMLEQITSEVVGLRSAVDSQPPTRQLGLLPFGLVTHLARAVGLRRAIETGTAGGDGTRLLSVVFPEVGSIELSPWLHARARENLAGIDGVTLLQGDSRECLPELVRGSEPTLYWLDGHWNGDPTVAGRGSDCPLLDEIEALRSGHPDDCVLIDDARFLSASPPPPFASEEWPGLLDVMQRLRDVRPDSYVTTVHDLVIAVPSRAKPIVDAFAWDQLELTPPELPGGPPAEELGRIQRFSAEAAEGSATSPPLPNGRVASLHAAVDAVPAWWHSIDLGDGVTTPGRKGGSNEPC